MSNILNDFVLFIEYFIKWIKELEFFVYQICESLFVFQDKVKFYVGIIEDIYNYKIDIIFLLDIIEVKYEDNILIILIYDVLFVYKVVIQLDVLKWKEMMYNVLFKLLEKLYFEKVYIVFEFYVFYSVLIKVDIDNWMLKILIDVLVMYGVIFGDIMYYMFFSCFGYFIDNMYCKILIKVMYSDNIYRVIIGRFDLEVVNKILVE